MATKKNPVVNLMAPLSASLVQQPANRRYVFARNCTNDHGHFAKGDKARGAFSVELVASYLQAGILMPAPTAPTPAEPPSDGH